MNAINVRIDRLFNIIFVFGTVLGLWLALLISPDRGDQWIWVAVGLQMAFFMIKPNAERAVWTLLAYLFSIGGAQLAIYNEILRSVPSWITWLSYVIISLAVIFTLIQRRRFYGTKFLLPVIALLISTLIIAVMYQVSIIDWLGWCLHFLRYPLLFFALINMSISISTYKIWIFILIGLAVVQIPTTMYQAVSLGVDVMSGITGTVDLTTGTMYGAQTGVMGLTVVMIFCLFFGIILETNKSIIMILLSFTLFIPLLLGGSNFALALGPIMAVYLVIRWGTGRDNYQEKKSFKLNYRFIWILYIGLFIFISVFVITRVVYPTGTSELLDWLNRTNPALTSLMAFTNPLFSSPQSRQRFVATVVNWFRLYPMDMVLGAIGPHLGLGSQGNIFRGLVGVNTNFIPLARINMAAYLYPDEPQFGVLLPRVMIEVGLVGLLCFLWLFWQAREVGSQARKKILKSHYLKGLTLGFEGIWLIYVIICVLYMEIWRVDQLSFIFWLVVAAIYVTRGTLEEQKTGETTA